MGLLGSVRSRSFTPDALIKHWFGHRLHRYSRDVAEPHRRCDRIRWVTSLTGLFGLATLLCSRHELDPAQRQQARPRRCRRRVAGPLSTFRRIPIAAVYQTVRCLTDSCLQLSLRTCAMVMSASSGLTAVMAYFRPVLLRCLIARATRLAVRGVVGFGRCHAMSFRAPRRSRWRRQRVRFSQCDQARSGPAHAGPAAPS